MRKLEGEEERKAMYYIDLAERVAVNSTCLRAKCGCVIVKSGEIIGQGFNSPPAEREDQRKCLVEKYSLDERVADKTCCIHAEQRAIINALRKNPNKLNNSKLYFARLSLDNERVFSGKPYCTHCSKLALDLKISEFILFHEEGIFSYDTGEYNLISFDYKDDLTILD